MAIVEWARVTALSTVPSVPFPPIATTLLALCFARGVSGIVTANSCTLAFGGRSYKMGEGGGFRMYMSVELLSDV
jgi:hypothetical protein